MHRTVWLIPSLLLTLVSIADGADALGVKPQPGSDRAKIASTLLPVVDAPAPTVAARLAALRSRVARAAAPDRLKVRLDVDVSDESVAAIAATGAAVVESAPRWKSITVEATPAQVEALSHLAAVRRVAPVLRPHLRQQGVAGNHADIDMGCDVLRTAYGKTGTGRKIGVISDTVNRTGAVGTGTVAGSVPNATLTGTTPQANGDLPTSVQVIDFGDSTGTDEGEGMMEVVHDVAPGSPLAFASCGDTQTSFATNIRLLRTSANCNVIVDDIGFPDEPVFQDGPIAQAIDDVHAAGALYFSAAGNEGDLGIVMPYSDISLVTDPHGDGTSFPSDGNDLHNWGIGGATPTFLPLDVPAGRSIEVYLEWNQPYQSYSLGAGSQADFDVYLFDGASVSSTMLDFGFDAQGTAGQPGGDPFEWCTYTNSGGSTHRVYLAVDHFGGLSSAVLSVIIYGTATSPNASVFNGPTIQGHPAAKGCAAVGAIFYGDIADPASTFMGGDTTAINAETFTSRGGVGTTGMAFYYDTTGQLLSGAPQRRNKPDIAAPDGVDTSVFGSYSRDYESDGFPNFFGTSCAAPNAAAAAALLWDLNPGYTNDKVLARLEATATDIVASNPVSGVGFDDHTGWGLVNAREAARAAITNVSSSAANGSYAGGNIPIQVTFTHAVTVTGTPQIALATGTTTRYATYTSGSGTTILTFTYAIQFGDSSADLDANGSGALTLNGGTIYGGTAGVSTEAATLTLPNPGAAHSLSANKNIAIHANACTVSMAPSPLQSQTNPSFTFNVVFSRTVTGFGVGSVVITNGSVASVTGSGTTYHVHVTGTSTGIITCALNAGGATDVYGYPTPAKSANAYYGVPAPGGGSAPPSTGGGGSHCGLGSSFALLAALGLVGAVRRRRHG